MMLKLYMDFVSQPARALYITLKQHKIPFEAIYVDLLKGEQLSKEFGKNVSRFNKVPVLNDNGFIIMESIGILRYLARTKNLSEKWYPQDPKRQALVDEYLEWQHNNTRAYCSLYFERKFLFPLQKGKITPPEKLKPYLENLNNCLDKIENLWLTPGPYINGHQHLTAADIWAAAEIEQLRLARYNPKEGRFILTDWLERIRSETNPYYDEAHTPLDVIVEDQIKNGIYK